jgi:DNA-binding transcriptional LysR family regulator
MNNRHIEAFRAVMIGGTITEGSRILNVSQPAVTRLIANLEAEIGFKVFDRHRGRLLPTAEGVQFYEEVQRSYVGLAKLADAAAAIREFRDGKIRLATLSAFSAHLIPEFLAKFSKSLPRVNFDIHVMSPERIRSGIADQQYHAGLVFFPVDHPSIEVEFLVSVPLVCVVPPKHRLAKRRELSIDDLRDEPLVLLSREFPLRLAIEAEFHRRQLRPNIRAETTVTAATCGLVQQGLGIAVTEPFTPLMFQKAGGVAIVPFTRSFKFRFAVITSGIGTKTRLLSQFVAQLKTHIEQFEFPSDLDIKLEIEPDPIP